MSTNDTFICVMKNGIGKGPEELQLILKSNYLQILGQGEVFPSAICFYSSRVKMEIGGSLVLEHLAAPEKKVSG